jgi:5-(carboxyamino)imidazole ribonucleotide mutase
MSEIQYKKVMIVMGSTSDWPHMKPASELLSEFNIEHHSTVVSAHRTPERMYEFAREAENQGTEIIIAGAGGSAHLPGMIAAISHLPVIGVPVQSKFNDGLDSLMSIVQMPRGVAVACQGVGSMGAYNAAVLSLQILSLGDPKLREAFSSWRKAKRSAVQLDLEP